MSRKDEQLARMRFLAGYGTISESKNNKNIEYSIDAADNKSYGIIREGSKYYIKSAPSSKSNVFEAYDYIGGWNNHKEYEYNSYNNALKQLELKVRSINESKGSKAIVEAIDLDKKESIIAEASDEMKLSIMRYREIMNNVSGIMNESSIIGMANTGNPEAPKTASFNNKIGGPFNQEAKAELDKDFNKKASKAESEGEPFGDKEKSEQFEDAKFVPDNSVANKKPSGGKVVKVNESNDDFEISEEDIDMDDDLIDGEDEPIDNEDADLDFDDSEDETIKNIDDEEDATSEDIDLDSIGDFSNDSEYDNENEDTFDNIEDIKDEAENIESSISDFISRLEDFGDEGDMDDEDFSDDSDLEDEPIDYDENDEEDAELNSDDEDEPIDYEDTEDNDDEIPSDDEEISLDDEDEEISESKRRAFDYIIESVSNRIMNGRNYGDSKKKIVSEITKKVINKILNENSYDDVLMSPKFSSPLDFNRNHPEKRKSIFYSPVVGRSDGLRFNVRGGKQPLKGRFPKTEKILKTIKGLINKDSGITDDEARVIYNMALIICDIFNQISENTESGKPIDFNEMNEEFNNVLMCISIIEDNSKTEEGSIRKFNNASDPNDNSIYFTDGEPIDGYYREFFNSLYLNFNIKREEIEGANRIDSDLSKKSLRDMLKSIPVKEIASNNGINERFKINVLTDEDEEGNRQVYYQIIDSDEELISNIYVDKDESGEFIFYGYLDITEEEFEGNTLEEVFDVMFKKFKEYQDENYKSNKEDTDMDSISDEEKDKQAVKYATRNNGKINLNLSNNLNDDDDDYGNEGEDFSLDDYRY